MRHRIWAGTVTLTNLKRVKGRDGVIRTYFQVKGQPLTRLPDAPLDSAEFLDAYAKAKAAIPAAVRGPAKGSLAALCDATMTSPAYRLKAHSTRLIMDRHIGAIRAKTLTALAADLRSRHISADLAALTPAVAQHRLKAWRLICKQGMAVGAMHEDPSLSITKPRLPPSEGHAPWTEAEVLAFRARWPIGTAARAMFEVLHWTGCRISDAVKIGPGMIDRAGVLTYRQQKTGQPAYVPWTCALPDYAAMMLPDRDMMHAALTATAGHMTFLPTKAGAPRSAKAISGDISSAARAAGVTKTAHGLRKARAVALAEAGGSSHQIGAWTGHESLTEISHYTAAANRRRAVMGTEQAQNDGTQAKSR